MGTNGRPIANGAASTVSMNQENKEYQLGRVNDTETSGKGKTVMPTPWSYFVSEPDSCEYHGPYRTKEEAVADAVLNGYFTDDEDDNGHIEVDICEGQYPEIDEIVVDGVDVLSSLEGTIWEIDQDSTPQEHIAELTNVMTNTFRMWARDHGAKFFELCETRNREIVSMPKPDHAQNIDPKE